MSIEEPHGAEMGGGMKKVLYTLQSVRRIGVRRATKALTSHNACKVCGLGMGGQLGGMTNELGEFPSVCNKSVQAQLTDIQPAIPAEVFNHTLAELKELDGYELERLGRLGSPIFKPSGADRYQPISWDDALDIAAGRLRGSPAERAFFYSSGRSSNEAGFILQLFARAYGTNNVNNCSYYCHQATSVALEHAIGTGTSTVELADLGKCDLIFLIGANPASNHPRFVHQLKACRERGGKVIVINPAREPGLLRFAVPKSPRSLLLGGTEIASDYLQPAIGSDIALFKGIAKAVLEQSGEHREFISAHTEGFPAFRADIESTPWEILTEACGVRRADIERVAATYCAADSAVLAWGMGVTHHIHGVSNVEQIANLALLRGMIGRPSAGLLPLRGHSNIQGIGTIGVKPVVAEDVFRAMEREFNVDLPRAPGMDTMACLDAASRGDVDVAVMMGGNLYEASPNSAWSEQALERIDSKIFLTTTLNRGHVVGVERGDSLILPVTARDEERQSTTQESMFNYVRLSDGGIHRLDNVRPEVDILCELGQRVLPETPIPFSKLSTHRNLRSAIARIVPGMEDLADIDIAKREFHVRNRLLHAPSFQTSSGKARFNVRSLPEHLPAAEDQFILSTVRSEGQFNTTIYEREDSYRQVQSRWIVLMNPNDMAELNLNATDRVTLVSDHGRMEGVQAYPYGLPTRNLLAYFPEANVLTSTAVDPESKTPAFKLTPVQIQPA
jgi:molybdopterin-dependent oxidoreductase alpha subunit